MASATLNAHQFSLLLHHQKLSHVNPSILLNPSLSDPLRSISIAPKTPSKGVVACVFPVWGPSFSGSGRSDFRAWSRRQSGSKGKSKRTTITLECTKCRKNRYTTEKNSLNSKEKLELNKYCPNCRLHSPHLQIK